MSEIKGKVWLFGDNIDTDVLAPGAYMKAPLAELASHCLEAIEPKFAQQVNAGDIIVAGNAFGIGSSREQAAQALVELGVAAIIAKSFARIFYRNALNLGLPVLECAELDNIDKDDVVSIDASKGIIINHSKDQQYHCEPIPAQLMTIVDAGGLMPYLEKKFKQ
ncbi:LeuD/DmdB family oxidoreductase small subunit [Colwellia sp. MEBiC06753]